MFSLCVHCGSRRGADPRDAEAARALGTAPGRAGHRLVYGGAGFHAPLLELLAHTRDAGFVDAAQVNRLRVDTDPVRLLETLRAEDRAATAAQSDFNRI